MFCTTAPRPRKRYPTRWRVAVPYRTPWTAGAWQAHPRYPVLFMQKAHYYPPAPPIPWTLWCFREGTWHACPPRGTPWGDPENLYPHRWHPRHPWLALSGLEKGVPLLLLWSFPEDQWLAYPQIHGAYRPEPYWSPTRDVVFVSGQPSYLVQVGTHTVHMVHGQYLAWLPDGLRVLTYSAGQCRLYRWDGHLLWEPPYRPQETPPWGWALSPGGRFLAIGTPDAVALYDLKSQEVHILHRPGLTTEDGLSGTMAWSPDGRYLAWFHTPQKVLHIFDLSDRRCQSLPPPREWWDTWHAPYTARPGLTWLPGGRWLVLSNPGGALVLDLRRGNFLRPLLHTTGVLPAPRGALLALHPLPLTPRQPLRVAYIRNQEEPEVAFLPPLYVDEEANTPSPVFWYPDGRALVVTAVDRLHLVRVPQMSVSHSLTFPWMPYILGKRAFYITSWGTMLLGEYGGVWLD